MNEPETTRIRELFFRIARVMAAEQWNSDLNPAQRDGLAFLARANRFSRNPASVAEYLCTTRGTASQTLKALARKGLVQQTQSAVDKRSICYDLTDTGRAVLAVPIELDAALEGLTVADASALGQLLEQTLHDVLKRRGFRQFGVCKTCRHYQRDEHGSVCALLDLPLADDATEQLCHEHAAVIDPKLATNR